MFPLVFYNLLLTYNWSIRSYLGYSYQLDHGWSYCKTYYTFDFQNFTHHNVTGNSSDSVLRTKDECSPLYLFGIIFGHHLIPLIICMAWFYTTDHRYGCMHLINKELTIRLRTRNILCQMLIILLMIPMNVVLALVLNNFGIPFVVTLSIFKFLIPFSKSKFNLIHYHLVGRVSSEPRIVFLYLLFTLQSISPTLIDSIMMTEIIISNKATNKFLSVLLLLINLFSLIYRIFHIWSNREQFKTFFIMINQIIPLLSTIIILPTILRTPTIMILCEICAKRSQT